MRIDRVLVMAASAGYFTLAGCGPARPPVAPVSGTVMFRNKPLATGRISFYPESGRAATGLIGSDGRYSLTTFAAKDGALLGPHRVVIEAREIIPPSQPPAKPVSTPSELIARELQMPAPDATASIKWIVPENYAALDTTPLTATVKAGKNVVDFTIP